MYISQILMKVVSGKSNISLHLVIFVSGCLPWISKTMSRWWQLKHFWNFHPDPWGFMIQFDGCICFKWLEPNQQLGILSGDRSVVFLREERGAALDFGFCAVLSIKQKGLIGVLFKRNLGGGFRYFLFSPLFGEMIQFD